MTLCGLQKHRPRRLAMAGGERDQPQFEQGRPMRRLKPQYVEISLLGGLIIAPRRIVRARVSNADTAFSPSVFITLRASPFHDVAATGYRTLMPVAQFSQPRVANGASPP